MDQTLMSVIPVVSQNIRKQLRMDMTVITQLYCQLYITCQLHVSANTILSIIRLDTIIGENYTIYNVIQYSHRCWSKYKELEGACVHKVQYVDLYI